MDLIVDFILQLSNALGVRTMLTKSFHMPRAMFDEIL